MALTMKDKATTKADTTAWPDALKQEFETLKNADPLVRQKNLEDAMAQVRGRIDELNRKISLGDISKPGYSEVIRTDVAGAEVATG